jgi:hypothetical protein
MLGALEVKAIARVAAQHRSEWKPIHAAVMGCLIAHRNRRTEQCSPHRKDIAAHCGVSERTVDRIVDQLKEWGAIERQQLRALSSQRFRTAQYTFLFNLPEPPAVEEPTGKIVDGSEEKTGPCDKINRAVRQNQGEPCDIQVSHGNKEEAKDLKLIEQSEKGNRENPPFCVKPEDPTSGVGVWVQTPECPECQGNGWKMIDGAATRCGCTRSGNKPAAGCEPRPESRSAVQGPFPPSSTPTERTVEAEEIADFQVAGLGATVADMVSWGLTGEEALAQYNWHRLIEAEKDRLSARPATNDRRRRYTQADFDERDWRKLQKEIDRLRQSGIGSAHETDPLAFFRRACERAGISTGRGNELYRKMLA